MAIPSLTLTAILTASSSRQRPHGDIIIIIMLSSLRRNALYCSLRYSFDISSFLSSLVSPGEVCWRHHLLNVSTTLQAEVDVIKDMAMLREDKQQCIFY